MIIHGALFILAKFKLTFEKLPVGLIMFVTQMNSLRN